MTRIIWMGFMAVVAAALSARAGHCQQLPLDGKPKWYEINVVAGATSGTRCIVFAATGQPAGELEPGHRFLSFGADKNRITLAHNGMIVFIPSDTAKEIYPDITPETFYRAPGKTLEKQAEELTAMRNSTAGLAPKRATPTPTPTPASSGRGGGGGGSRGGGGGGGGGSRSGGGGGMR
ncbi:MAG: hypothetical protein NTY46_09040 [Candidatus Sumerlaeota bacterium]|nr:hypothetical protein [Candidatus Sumerlaeota bacterium]